MNDGINLSNILFLDVETVPMAERFEELPQIMQHLWDEKTAHSRPEGETAADVWDKQGSVTAEFAKIVCISVGFLRGNDPVYIRTKSYYGDDEKKLLSEFAALLNDNYNSPYHMLAAHNGKQFDFPVIARRMLINGIALPKVLDFAGKKPWEVNHIDTMELWKFGDFRYTASIKLLTAVFGIPSPKDDIDGSQVAGVYYQDKDLPRIARYCEKDVTALIQVYLSMKNLPKVEYFESASFPQKE